jgi:hypothetical protein
MLELIKYKAFQELLIGHADFDGLAWRAVLEIPVT